MDQDIAKRAEAISKSARLARRVPRSSRACGKNLEESCQIFKQKSRDDFEVLKISNVFRKISNVFRKISNVFQKISNVFWDRSEFFSLTAPLSLPCQLRATTSAAYFTMSSSLFLHVECVVHALLFGEEIAAVVVVGLDFHRHIFHNLKAIGF